MVTVRLFAIYKEKAKTDRFELDIKQGMKAKDLLEAMKEKIPSIRDIIKEGRGMLAVNQEVAKPDTIVNDGDEVALIPPVSGG